MDFQPILPEELGMDNMGGMRNRIVIIPASFCKVVPKSTLIKNAENSNDLTVSKSVVPPDTPPENVFGGFVLKDGKKPIYVRCTLDTVSYTPEKQGERDGYSYHITGEFFIPGMTKKAATLARLLNNLDCYIIMENREGEQVQVGEPGLPVSISAGFASGTAPADRRGFSFTYETNSYAPFLFSETPMDINALEAEDEAEEENPATENP